MANPSSVSDPRPDDSSSPKHFLIGYAAGAVVASVYDGRFTATQGLVAFPALALFCLGLNRVYQSGRRFAERFIGGRT